MDIANRSDLEIEVIFKDKKTGEEIPVPIYDFELSYYVYTDKVHTASQVNKKLSSNCKVVDGRLHIYLDSPDFGCGVLRTRHKLDLPNSKFGDRVRTTVREGCLNVMIVENPCYYSGDPVIISDVIAELYSIVEILSAEDDSVIISEEGYEFLIDQNNGRRSN